MILKRCLTDTINTMDPFREGVRINIYDKLIASFLEVLHQPIMLSLYSALADVENENDTTEAIDHSMDSKCILLIDHADSYNELLQIINKESL